MGHSICRLYRKQETLDQQIDKVIEYCQHDYVIIGFHREPIDLIEVPQKVYYVYAATNEYLSDNLDDAKRKANEIRQLRIESDNRVQRQSEAVDLYNRGRQLWDAAWEAEHNDNSDVATAKFQEALAQFQQAIELHPGNALYCRYVRLAQYKLEGNAAFNDGLSLQEEGNRLVKLKLYAEAAAKYVKAMESFKKAAALHGDDAERFNECVVFVRDTLMELKTTIKILKQGARLAVVSGLMQLVKTTRNVQLNEQSEQQHDIDTVFEYLLE